MAVPNQIEADVERAATPATSPYNPRYDPLLAPTPGQGQGYAPTYWSGASASGGFTAGTAST